MTNGSSRSVTLTLAPSGGMSSFSGVIQDGFAGGQTSLTINGAGVLQLDGNNTFTGATTVVAGTLAGDRHPGQARSRSTPRHSSPRAITPARPISAASAP